jgi:hypothetical protein
MSYVGCAISPLAEPDKKVWLECSKGAAKRNLAAGLVIAFIILIIIIVMFVSDSGLVGKIIMIALGLIITFGAVYTYQNSDVTADTAWRDAKAKISRKMDDPNAFDNYANEEPEKKKELRRQWLNHGEKLLEIERDEARTRALQSSSRRGYNRRYGNPYGHYGAPGGFNINL